jgi:sulfatase maturation enzyme AslB (radical SAM superfamily)
MYPDCSSCPVIGFCRGGCRNCYGDDETMKATCYVRREVMRKIVKLGANRM